MIRHYLNSTTSITLSVVILTLIALKVHAGDLSLSTLDGALAQSESNYPDIVKGTEKQIVWHAQPGVKTPISIVYLHGFSATHKELSPMTENLAQRLGANTFYSRLRGHGRSDDAMAEATTNDWKADAREAYEIGALIGDKVLFIGTSTGGTLSTWLMTQPFIDSNKVLANILISPNFAINGSGTWILKSSVGMWFAKLISGDYRGFTPQNDFHAMYWTERYPMEALQPMLALLDDVDDIDKSKITTPHLLVYSPKDAVIDVEKAIETVDEMLSASVTKIPFTTSTDPAQHVLVGRGSIAVGDYQEQVDNMLSLLSAYIRELR
jgi:esterase/lipase